MALSDLWKNLLNTTASVTTFLGYRPTETELAGFPFDMYKFVMKSVRDRDQSGKLGGSRMLERLMEGPQEIWMALWQKATDLQDQIFDPEEIPIEFINGLRKLTAWGEDLADSWVAASEDEQRKMVARGIPFWSDRWLDVGLETAIRIVTGNRFRIRDYFDFRWIVGENMLFEELDDLDVNVLSVGAFARFQQGADGATQYASQVRHFRSATAQFISDNVGDFVVIQDLGASSNGVYEIVSVINSTTVEVDQDFPAAETSLDWFLGFNYDEYITEIRVVDDVTGQGAVNRTLLEKLLDLQRPNSERFNVAYITFLDLFGTDGDLGQWGTVEGSAEAVVDEGFLQLTGTGGHLPSNYYQDSDWTDYSLAVKAAFLVDGSLVIYFFYLDENNHYKLEVARNGFGSGVVNLWKVVSGTPTQIGSDYSFPDLTLNTYWTYRIHAIVEAATAYLKVEIDGDPVLDETDTAFDEGKIALGVENIPTPYPSDLVVLAHYNDTTPSFDLDYVRDGGSPTGNATGTPTIDTVDPKFGGGDLLLNGTEQVTYSGANIIDALVLTGCISLWFKPNYTGTPATIQTLFYSDFNWSLANRIWMMHHSNGNLILYVSNSGGANMANISSAWAADNNWHHLEGNFNVAAGSPASRFFLDGTQIGSTDTNSGTRTGTTNRIGIGKSYLAGVAQNIHVDEVQVYDTVQHTANFTPPTAELEADSGDVKIDLVEIMRFPMDLVRVGPNP